MILSPPLSTLFPYTTLFRSSTAFARSWGCRSRAGRSCSCVSVLAAFDRAAVGDRKSTRLNSSHRCISYAVFCLKKKNKFRLGQYMYIAVVYNNEKTIYDSEQ